MRRREFITLLGCAGVVWPGAARAQGVLVPTIGFISSGSPDTFADMVVAFQGSERDRI